MKVLDILAAIGLITVIRISCKAASWANDFVAESISNNKKKDGH